MEAGGESTMYRAMGKERNNAKIREQYELRILGWGNLPGR